MATVTSIPASNVICGDNVVINNNTYIVKYIDGPDKIGTYDLNVIDQFGNSHIEIVTGLVTISL
jgi:hypothetical protein